MNLRRASPSADGPGTESMRKRNAPEAYFLRARHHLRRIPNAKACTTQASRVEGKEG